MGVWALVSPAGMVWGPEVRGAAGLNPGRGRHGMPRCSSVCTCSPLQATQVVFTNTSMPAMEAAYHHMASQLSFAMLA